MDELDKYVGLSRKLVAITDELLESEEWQKSLFMRASRKQILQVRDKIQSVLNKLEDENKDPLDPEKSIHALSQDKNMVEIYVNLYQIQGERLTDWQDALKAISQNSIGRPCYRKESSVIKAIKERGNPIQEGYVCVYVNKNDLVELPEGEIAKDRFGNKLLTLREESLRPEHIVRFVHANKQAYRFENGQLIVT